LECASHACATEARLPDGSGVKDLANNPAGCANHACATEARLPDGSGVKDLAVTEAWLRYSKSPRRFEAKLR